MERIASFNVDHTTLLPGLYISRVDGDITTYDLRTRKPNTPDLMSHAEMHSTEHLFATFARNSSIKDSIIYFGPMGCQTGYYLLIRDACHERVVDFVKEITAAILEYDGEMPGNSEPECGNYANLSIEAAKEGLARYYQVIKDWSVDRLSYNNGAKNE